MKLNLRTLLAMRPVVEAAIEFYNAVRSALDANDQAQLKEAFEKLLDVDDWAETLADLLSLLALAREVVSPGEWEEIERTLRALLVAIREAF